MILHGGVALVSEENQRHGEQLASVFLIPAGLIVDEITESETVLVVSARAKASGHACPRCGTLSSRAQSICENGS
jgi:hypothetical protein